MFLRSMFLRPVFGAALAIAVCLSASAANAHFLWLLTTKNAAGKPVVQAHFSEAADAPEPELLKRLEGLQVWQRPQAGDTRALTVKQTPEAFEVEVPAGAEPQQPGVILSEKNFGVTGRGDVKFLLQYYAKVYLGDISAAPKLGPTGRLRLDIVPVIEDKTLALHVTWQGKPVADAEVVIKGPGLKGDKIKTDAQGLAKVNLADAGLLEIRARHIENQAGEFEGKAYTEIRHYCTLTLPWAGVQNAKPAK
jgi:hypothetical protein